LSSTKLAIFSLKSLSEPDANPRESSKDLKASVTSPVVSRTPYISFATFSIA
jgi:hypothetical protein